MIGDLRIAAISSKSQNIANNDMSCQVISD